MAKNRFFLITMLLLSISMQSQTIDSDSIQTQAVRAIGFGVQPDWKITGAVSSVQGEELSKTFTTNVANTLNGRLPGLTVLPGGGEAGADSPTLRGRGLATFGSGRDMLIIIDGFPSSQRFFEQLTPQEIETISFLKDASATAVYGNRAANGVLLVTTKRGEIAPLTVNFTLQYGMQQATRLPDFLDSYNYAKLYNEALVNDFGPGSEIYSESDLEAYRTGSDPLYHPNVDWYNEVLRQNAPLVNANFTARGGSNTVRYFVLFNAVDNHGLYERTEGVSESAKNQSYIRYNFRTNVDITLSRRLSAMVTLGGTVEDKTTPGVYETTNDIFSLMSKVSPAAFPVEIASGKPGGSSMYRNPLSEITQRGYVSYNGRAAQTSARLNGDLGMITPGLSVAGAIGFNTYFKSFSKKTRDYARFSVSQDASGNPVYSQSGQETSLSGNEGESYQWRNYILQAFLNYDRAFGPHDVNAMLTANYDDYTEGDNYSMGSGSVLPYKNIGFAGRFTYSFDRRYIAEFSFGYTGSDAFLEGKRFGFFPAGSLGWIVSNEGFLKDNAVLDYLKIRGSYGLTGNANIGARFLYNQYYSWSGYNLGKDNGSKSALLQSVLSNPDASWEKDKKANIGFDATLFDRFTLSLDYFRQRRYDILTKPYSSVPDYLGFTLPDMNVGEVENKGFEAVAGYEKKQTSGLSYFVRASMWFARNEVINSAEAPQLYEYLYQKGQRIDQPFLLEAIGLFSDDQDIANSPSQIFAEVQAGDIKYKNQNPEDDNIINSNDYYPIGYTSLPEFTMGLHTGIQYKNVDLDFFFQGAANRSVYWGGAYFHAFQDYGKVSSVALGRWTESTASTATYPRLSSSDNQNNYQYSTFWQKNGDFLKLRSLELGYTLPRLISERIGIKETRLYFNATNLFSLDHMEGLMDPESVSGGTGYPVPRTFSFGLSIQL